MIIFNLFSSRIKNDTSIKGERFHVFQNGQALKILGTEKNDSGIYVCVASNTEGMSFLTAVLDVKGILATLFLF